MLLYLEYFDILQNLSLMYIIYIYIIFCYKKLEICTNISNKYIKKSVCFSIFYFIYYFVTNIFLIFYVQNF